MSEHISKNKLRDPTHYCVRYQIVIISNSLISWFLKISWSLQIPQKSSSSAATRWRLKSAEWHGGGSGADRAGSCAALCLRSQSREIAAHFEQPIIARHHCATEVAGGSVQARWKRWRKCWKVVILSWPHAASHQVKLPLHLSGELIMHSCILVIFVCFVLVAINKCRMPTNLLSMLSMFSPPDDLTDAHVWFSWFILHFCWVCKVVVTLALAIFFSYLGLLGLFGHTRHRPHICHFFSTQI